MNKEKYGVHISHCCYIHGCKYGDEDCPVVSGEVAQKYLCYDCSEEYEPYTLEEIERLRKTKSYRPTYEQLKDKVADLEAKLAESEAKIACREDDIKFKEADINQLKWILEGKKKDIDQLKQQLADKDQAIECLQEINKSLGQTCNNDAKEIERLREQLKLAKMGESFEQEKKNNALKSQNQTAIAELRKVLKTMEEKQFYKKEDTAYCVHPAQIAEYVLKQIKSLKGDKVE